MADVAFAELFCTINSDKFRRDRRSPFSFDDALLHTAETTRFCFFSSLLQKDSIWIFGSEGRRSSLGLWHVQVPDFKVLLKKTIGFLDDDTPAIMASFGKQILVVKKGGNEIYSINTDTEFRETVFKDANFQIDAMCCNDEHLYIFQKKSPGVIQILDSKFQSTGCIPTGLKENVAQVDLCTATMTTSALTEEQSSLGFKTEHKHMCIISISKPGTKHPSVRAVNETGVIWQVDSRSCPELDNSFNPYSISSSTTGDIFIADNGADRVSKVADMGYLLGFLKTLLALVEITRI